MSLKMAELEIVRYRTNDIMHATTRMIGCFARYSGIPETGTWVKLLSQVQPLVMNQQPTNIEWRTGLLDLRFAAFLEPIPKIKDGKLFFSSGEPKIVFEEVKNDTIIPSKENHVRRVVEAIVDEMSDVYKLRQQETNPVVLTFPKEEYAKKIEVYSAALINQNSL